MRYLNLSLTVLALLHGANAQTASYNIIVEAHGIIGCIAWVVLFPLGAVAIRLLDGPHAWLVHAIIQVFAYMMVVVNAGLGIWMGVVSDQLNYYHPKIGLVLFVLTFFQPIGGLLHHLLFTKQKRSSIVTQTHIWLGRTLITLGMINGGLGMLFGGDPTSAEDIVYGVVAGAIWLGWVLVVVYVKVKYRKVEISRTQEAGGHEKSEKSRR